MAESRSFWTTEQFLSASRKDKLHTVETPVQPGWINSLAYNCTSTFLDQNPEISRKFTGIVYKRFKGLIWGKTKTPGLNYDQPFVSSLKLFKIFPTKCKGNVILPKKSVMKDFKMEGLLPKS